MIHNLTNANIRLPQKTVTVEEHVIRSMEYVLRDLAGGFTIIKMEKAETMPENNFFPFKLSNGIWLMPHAVN